MTRNVYFLPIRSPNLPKNSAPNGRTTKPAANVARVDNKASTESPSGKNFLEITAGKASESIKVVPFN